MYQNLTIGTFWYASATPAVRERPYQNLTIGTFWYASATPAVRERPYQNLTIGTFWYGLRLPAPVRHAGNPTFASGVRRVPATMRRCAGRPRLSGTLVP